MFMKKYLLLVLAFSSFTSIQAQFISEHLSFKGVPIDGKLEEYVSKMKQNGFTHIQTDNGTAYLNGDFAGYKDCYVGVTTLKQKDLVHKISVVFSEKDTWSKLSTNYFELKKMITEKYGKPTEEVEKFDVSSYAQPKDDNAKLYEEKFDRCKYYTIWQTEKGEIQLSIDHSDVTSCFVKLTYLDKINAAIVNAKAKDDL